MFRFRLRTGLPRSSPSFAKASESIVGRLFQQSIVASDEPVEAPSVSKRSALPSESPVHQEVLVAVELAKKRNESVTFDVKQKSNFESKLARFEANCVVQGPSGSRSTQAVASTSATAVRRAVRQALQPVEFPIRINSSLQQITPITVVEELLDVAHSACLREAKLPDWSF